MRLSAQFTRFAVIGGAGFVVDVGLLYLLMWVGLGPYLARAVSLLTAATFTWRGNRRFTFDARARPGPAMRREWVLYVTAMVIGGGVNYGVYAALITWSEAFAAWPVLAVVVSTGCSMLINFTSARLILHRPF